MPPTLSDQYEHLRNEGIRLTREGDLQAAAPLFHQAHQIACEFDDQDLMDRALCNYVGVRIELKHRCDDQFPQLRRILNRNSSTDTCQFAAWHLARAYGSRKQENKKALFYARIALAHAQTLGDDELIASSNDLIGTLLVAESFFDKGLIHYRAALEANTELPPTLQALIVQNIGYCHLMLGKPLLALGLMYKSLRVLRRQPRQAVQAHLDIAMALLEVGKYSHAMRHAARALNTVEGTGRDDDIKNSLYLLGEAANLLGSEEIARDHFSRLQRYYPDTPFLEDFLLATDIRQMVNLRA